MSHLANQCAFTHLCADLTGVMSSQPCPISSPCPYLFQYPPPHSSLWRWQLHKHVQFQEIKAHFYSIQLPSIYLHTLCHIPTPLPFVVACRPTFAQNRQAGDDDARVVPEVHSGATMARSRVWFAIREISLSVPS